MITARIRLEVPRETVVVVADTERAVENIVAALRQDGVYDEHEVLAGNSLVDEGRVRLDRGGWISGPCLGPDQVAGREESW